MGYFLSKDEYVIRKDMSMLADAGVDVLVMDVTNAVRYWDEWDVIFPVMQRMKAEGNKVPQFCFWAFNGPAITVVQDLYDKVYKVDKYKDLWFHWDGKPLLLVQRQAERRRERPGDTASQPALRSGRQDGPEPPALQRPRLRRRVLQGLHPGSERVLHAENDVVGISTSGPASASSGRKTTGVSATTWAMSRSRRWLRTNWSRRHKGVAEEAAVTPGQHPSSLTGKCWTREHGEPELNEYDLPVPTHVPWLGKTVEHPEGYGIYFQQRWDEALQVNPQFLYINDWNEWTAGKYQPPAGQTLSVHAARQPVLLRRPVQRRVQPLHPADEGRVHRQLLHADGPEHPALQGHSPDSRTERVAPDHDRRQMWRIGRASTSSTATRSAMSFIATTRVMADCTTRTTRAAMTSSPARWPSTATTCISACRPAQPLTSHTDNNWMLLLIDADQNHDTGWYGYDYLINKKDGRRRHDDADALRCGVRQINRGSSRRNSSIAYAGNGTGAGRARVSCIGLPGRCTQFRFPLVRQSGRAEGPDLALPQRRQCPEPAIQLPLHLEEIVEEWCHAASRSAFRPARTDCQCPEDRTD